MKVKSKHLLGQLSDMDIRLLRVFKSVVDCGGMAAAELELNIGISTISRHVKDLEVRLGLTLCRRGRGGFSVTPEGQKVYEQTVALLAATDSFRTGVDEIHQRLRGDLSVALFDKTASNPKAHVDRAIALFCDQAPDVNINVYIAPINAIEQGLVNGQFQVGVLPGHGQSSSLDYTRLFGERMQLYCGPGHRLFDATEQQPEWTDLRQHRFAGLGYHSPNMALSLQRRIARSATAFDQEGIATLILSGRFIGFLPDHYAQTFVALKKMQALNPASLQYDCDFFSAVRRSPQPARTTGLFMECLRRVHENG
jgi:DNA-binding transcriptional LysR family regulator